VSSFSASTGTSTLFVTLSGGRTPLQGSDGHVYIPVSASSFNAYEGKLLSWTFSAPTAVLRQATMDCQGRVFVGHGATVLRLHQRRLAAWRTRPGPRCGATPAHGQRRARGMVTNVRHLLDASGPCTQ